MSMIPIGVPINRLLPEGIYLFSVDRLEETVTKEGAKLMFKATLTIIEPVECGGMKQFENFVIGIDSDPQARDATTWKRNASALKQFVTAVGVPFDGQSSEQVCAEVMGLRFIGQIKHSKDNEFANLRKCSPEGSAIPFVGETSNAPMAPPLAKSGAGQTPTAPGGWTPPKFGA